MEGELQIDRDCFEEFLYDVDVEKWIYDNEQQSDNSDGFVRALPSDSSVTFCSTKDTRTLAKIRKQARRQQYVSTDLSGRKRKKSVSPVQHAQTPRLVAFPQFEKCDSLVFFPHTLSRLVNSSDRTSLVRVLNTYFDNACEVQFCAEAYKCAFPHKRLLDFITLTWEANPDYIMCVHDTKVVENVISASTYFKYTECKFLTDSVRSMTKDPLFLEMMESPNEQLKRELRVDSKPEDERRALCAILDSGQDVLVYGRMDLHVRFDPYSKKIVALQFAMRVSSVV